jgi:2-dehydro-3-deoxyphosphogluconate aldolase / (4S)-4-hydroxy-2-oxoglutarate aldolase
MPHTMSRREETAREIKHRRVTAIVRAADAATARAAARAALAGGFAIIEFTMTTPQALELVAEFAADADVLVGAGTVLTTAEATQAVQAGAKFLVSPIADPAIIAIARRLDVVSMPGTYTPTEMMQAHRWGADFVKLFPAPADIPAYIRQILGPLPYLQLFPTAGVSPENFVDVLRAGAAGVGFVSSLFRPEDLAAQDFAAIQRRAGDICNRLPT